MLPLRVAKTELQYIELLFNTKSFILVNFNGSYSVIIKIMTEKQVVEMWSGVMLIDGTLLTWWVLLRLEFFDQRNYELRQEDPDVCS
jgi:hypothetical protein